LFKSIDSKFLNTITIIIITYGYQDPRAMIQLFDGADRLQDSVKIEVFDDIKRADWRRVIGEE
jgi:hypothetical protein